jgi:hypothetical protein
MLHLPRQVGSRRIAINMAEQLADGHSAFRSNDAEIIPDPWLNSDAALPFTLAILASRRATSRCLHGR